MCCGILSPVSKLSLNLSIRFSCVLTRSSFLGPTILACALSKGHVVRYPSYYSRKPVSSFLLPTTVVYHCYVSLMRLDKPIQLTLRPAGDRCGRCLGWGPATVAPAHRREACALPPGLWTTREPSCEPSSPTSSQGWRAKSLRQWQLECWPRWCIGPGCPQSRGGGAAACGGGATGHRPGGGGGRCAR